MSMFRKAASAVIPAPVEPVHDTIVTQDAEQVEPASPVAASEEIASHEAATQPKHLRPGSKGAALLAMRQREEGASLDEMIERTGWQGHTVRAAMTGFRKKGHVIDKRTSGNSNVWFVAAETLA